jgi:integrase
MAILKKTHAANIHGLSNVKGFPVILDESYRVHDLSLRYFIKCFRTAKVSSIATYAAHICDFISQLEVDEKSVSDINDAWLHAYKESIINRDISEDNNTLNYASQVLRTVVNYCYWLTQTKAEPYLCGLTESYKIIVSLGNKNKIKHATIKNNNQNKRKLQAPRTAWIEKVLPFGPQRPDLARRFELMIDWGRFAGLRAHEICQLKINNLPSRETAENAINEQRLIPTNLTTTKGGEAQTVRVGGDLIVATWDYIDLYRSGIVKKIDKRNKKKTSQVSYKEPKEVFLSDETGLAMKAISFSSAVRKAYLKAVERGLLTEDERVWTHGLRHHFVTKDLRNNDESGQKHAEQLSMQQSRHGSIDAMEAYLGDRFSEDFN